ncbi:hypothetical protein [Schleiferia thermophila]|uniref:Uncharacterized protein n=1 Tax=Schleiferia thermophila TaxID=884107 RepID=A0A369A0P3_9FLAO|nr:hypothetical protein [Schleiferia thermophila]RCX01936.1 hypothetical protein DES35_10635 [Schleiferia thermophila]
MARKYPIDPLAAERLVVHHQHFIEIKIVFSVFVFSILFGRCSMAGGGDWFPATLMHVLFIRYELNTR